MILVTLFGCLPSESVQVPVYVDVPVLGPKNEPQLINLIEVGWRIDYTYHDEHFVLTKISTNHLVFTDDYHPFDGAKARVEIIIIGEIIEIQSFLDEKVQLITSTRCLNNNSFFIYEFKEYSFRIGCSK